MSIVKNPILPGFNPDPSICRVGDDYYIVNSSFAYFPSIPIYHTRDFSSFTMLGNVLDRTSQFNGLGMKTSDGIFAPTIRYHNGLYYVITTNMPNGQNFYVTADNPSGPWTDPYIIEGATGIDPSLFFDDNGTSYYIGTRENSVSHQYYGDNEIYICEIDLSKSKFSRNPTPIWKGSMKNSIWPEGPHMYSRNGYYYLMIAEGGTEFNHSITICRSRHIFGPYENCPHNPILTHRHLGHNYPVRYTGHGDLFETQNGNWLIVLLASSNIDGSSNLGRETYLAKVEWCDDWPIINPGVGVLTPNVDTEIDNLPVYNDSTHITFDKPQIDSRIVSLRTRKSNNYHLNYDKGWLSIRCCSDFLVDQETSYYAIRQPSFSFRFETLLNFKPLCQGDAAGICLYQDEKNNVRFEYVRLIEEDKLRINVKIDGIDYVVYENQIDSDTVYLSFVQRGLELFCFWGINDPGELIVETPIDVSKLCSEFAGGFVGCTVGLFACSYECESVTFANFKYIDCKP